ncbi:MAG: flagellar hook-associated protein FlgL [Desulfovibrionales bacterium]|nr:flagellar hook-associated protein FlgL [Desulfovibrionales bacterium]
MRVTLRNQYSNFLYNVQQTQSKLMDLNMQASSQKRINKPSDDAVGTTRVLNYRNSIAAIDQYRKNIDMAKGWLGLADETMMQTSTIITSLKGLAEQGSTGTMTQKDREAASYEARQLFQQLLNLANTEFEGSSIFAGHKVNGNAFEAGLMVYDQDGNHLGVATGMAERSILVQFVGEAGTTATVGTDTITYRYSDNGGVSWTTKTLDTAVSRELDLGGVSITLPSGKEFALSPTDNTKTSEGSWLTVAPTAIYQGDHEMQSAVTYGVATPTFTALPLGGFEQDVTVTFPPVTFGDGTSFPATVTTTVAGVSKTTTVTVPNLTDTPLIETPYGAIQLSGSAPAGGTFTVSAGDTGVKNFGSDVNAVGKGYFSSDIAVRIDNTGAVDIGDGTALSYSYSIDGGVTWSTGHTAANTADPAELLVPGGKLVLSERGGSTALDGAQFVIHPQTAGHDVEITTGEYLRLNNIGSMVFGGHYDHGTEPVFADTDPSKNMFVTVGKLVAALENNDQQGCAEALENLKSVHEHFVTQLASVGARENRLDVADTVLAGLKLNQKARMSATEDVDLVQLMTDLANQQLSYEAVLKSSSMIMRMSLLNYL